MTASEIIDRIDYEVVLGDTTDDEVLEVVDALVTHYSWALQILLNDGRQELAEFVTERREVVA
jgi:hypothetical protein